MVHEKRTNQYVHSRSTNASAGHSLLTLVAPLRPLQAAGAGGCAPRMKMLWSQKWPHRHGLRGINKSHQHLVLSVHMFKDLMIDFINCVQKCKPIGGQHLLKFYSFKRFRKTLKIQKLWHQIEYKSLISLVVPWICHASCMSHQAQEVRPQTWTASLFDFSCPHPTALQAWMGNTLIQVCLFPHHSIAPVSPQSPAYPSLKLSHSVSEIIS